jgi:hypothetical protein
MRRIGLLLLVLVPLLLSGCGGSSSSSSGTNTESGSGIGVSKLQASQTCMTDSCHGTSASPGTGALIVTEWKASTHNTRNGAGCADCHEPDSGHPQACSKCHGGGSGAVTRNPDMAAKCGKCHGPAHPNDVMMVLSPQHFGNMTASALNTGYRPSWVTTRYRNNCTACHNPHDPSSAINIARQWADSLGNTSAGAFRSDFKTRGTSQPAATSLGSYCVRCHTTTGYLNFVMPDKTGLRFNDQHAWGDASDKTKEVIGCDVCHDNGKGKSYGYAVRAIPAVSTYYNYSAANGPVSMKITGKAVNFPDFGISNVCVPCHVGRGVGQVIYDAAALGLDFANANSVPTTHNRAAGATISQKNGYEFSGRSYTNAAYQHGAIGMNNVRGTGYSGPCVACHMKNGPSHDFLPVTLDPATAVITGITSGTCAKCHDGSYQQAWSVASLQAKRDGYSAALVILNLLKNYPSTTTIPGKSKYPALSNKNTDWNTFAPGFGANTMGAVFNYSMMTGDPASFAHNPLYTKRLIYDSIDWLNDGVLNNDVEAAINAATLPPNTATATKGYVSLKNPITPAYYFTLQAPSATTDAIFAKVKADAINYLLGGPGRGRP